MRLQKNYYRDLYGGSASIRECRDGSWLLTVCDGYGGRIHRKSYASARGARIALGKWSDSWEKY